MAGSGVTVQAEVATAIRTFRFDALGLSALLKGPVMANLVRRAIRVESSAKTYATGIGGGPNVRTGRLRGSITWRAGMDARSPFVDIGSAVEYAAYVELGTTRMPAYPFLRPALEAARSI